MTVSPIGDSDRLIGTKLAPEPLATPGSLTPVLAGAKGMKGAPSAPKSFVVESAPPSSRSNRFHWANEVTCEKRSSPAV